MLIQIRWLPKKNAVLWASVSGSATLITNHTFYTPAQDDWEGQKLHVLLQRIPKFTNANIYECPNYYLDTENELNKKPNSDLKLSTKRDTVNRRQFANFQNSELEQCDHGTVTYSNLPTRYHAKTFLET
jgi:hypothetical protein